MRFFFVIFKKIEGLKFLNDGQPIKIVKINKISFFIEKVKENNNNDKYISNGYIEEYKIPKNLNLLI